jgi:pyruvate,water dikinase
MRIMQAYDMGRSSRGWNTLFSSLVQVVRLLPNEHWLILNTMFMSTYIKKFHEISIRDVAVVGGKNASLGEMTTTLAQAGIKVPQGFATTSDAFWFFIDFNKLRGRLEQLMSALDREEFSNLEKLGAEARGLILKATMPGELDLLIRESYNQLKSASHEEVAVRSSATAEDLPTASFAGQHESFLNIRGEDAVVDAVKRCIASLYTDRAIKYREDNGFEHGKVALSVGVQTMVRSDKASSGIGFTLDPETGFRNVIHLSGVWGLGENIVQGAVTPDEYYVFKPTLEQNKRAIIQKKLGSKEKTLVYSGGADGGTVNMQTSAEKKIQFVLTDDEILTISKWALLIEQHYNKAMDIEWAKDGLTNELYIIQARPETVHSRKNPAHLYEYRLLQKGKKLVSGQAVGSKIATGVARVLGSPKDAHRLQVGDIVVTEETSPDWDPLLKKAAAIVTNKGGRTSHASIVARELGVPAIVGAAAATESISDGELITVSCSEGHTGFVYEGALKFEVKEMDMSAVQMPEAAEAMLIAADPDSAFELSFYPNDGVGLLRMEFIVTHHVGIHPMALVKFDELKPDQDKDEIQKMTAGYSDKRQFFVEKLSQGIAMIAAAFYPKDVIVRMSDFKTNEYANLLGGRQFEPHEENPMIGFRGASRYYNPLYRDGFQLECEAIKRVRDVMGLTNVKVMIPFCRTPEEGRRVVGVMKTSGLNREKDPSLEIYMMVEIPSNVIEADEFAKIFDGFSIGSNDLTQLTLGIDRDSSLVADLFSEKNTSAMYMISTAIRKAKENGIKIGLCGQAPSDFPEFAQFLVSEGIDSISFNADSILKGIENIRKAEKKAGSNYAHL